MGNELARVIGEVLKFREETIAVAESITAGNLQAAFSSNSGSSDYFEGGITAYSLRQKVELLGVDEEEARAVNCVSQNVAREMAKAVSVKFGTDYGIGTAGYAESLGDVEFPYAYYAVSANGAVIKSGRVDGTGLNREAVQMKVCNVALRSLADYLEI